MLEKSAAPRWPFGAKWLSAGEYAGGSAGGRKGGTAAGERQPIDYCPE